MEDILSTLKNPTLTFDLAQIQVVPFQCNQFFYLKPQGHQIKMILKSVVSLRLNLR
jgi:hypothetical protein